VLLVCVTFPLIWVGGLVTTYDAGMAVPDWPSTYGYNLFLYPWTTWVFGPFKLFVEHGHRLLASLAGMLTIGLVVSTCFQEKRIWVRKAAFGALALVLVQGILGGARVLLDERVLAMLHGCIGPAYFAYCVALAVMTSGFWREGLIHIGSPDTRFVRLSLMTAAIIYLQLVLGARIRHMGAEESPNAFRITVLFHVAVAIAVAAHTFILAARSWKKHIPQYMRLPATAAGVLVVVQIGLGLAVWLLKYGWPFGLNERFQFAATTIVQGSLLQAMTTNTHVVLGSLILAFSVVCAVRSCRFFRTDEAVAKLGEPRRQVNWQWEAST